MSRPDDVPEDVWEAAEAVALPAFEHMGFDASKARDWTPYIKVVTGLARAILAERERVADELAEPSDAMVIAFQRGARIRNSSYAEQCRNGLRMALRARAAIRKGTP